MIIMLSLIFRKSDWEANFREKSEVISTAEMVCCRRIVELCRHMITAGYYYHFVNCPKSHAKQRRLDKKKINSYIMITSSLTGLPLSSPLTVLPTPPSPSLPASRLSNKSPRQLSSAQCHVPVSIPPPQSPAQQFLLLILKPPLPLSAGNNQYQSLCTD